MKTQIILVIGTVLFLIYIPACNAQDYPIKPVDIKDVKLTDAFWLPKIQTVQEVTIDHSFTKCEEEGRMENFLIAGGQMKGKTRGKMPFDDTDLYKIIEGASYSLISSPNPELEAYIDSVIAIIAVGQQEDGYITTWHTIDSLHPPANWVTPAPRWESEISSHELYNAGHLFEAAAAHYTATGKTSLLHIAEKFADLLVVVFGEGKREAPPGHQIVETGLVRLYRINGRKDYLNLAKFFLDIRGDSTTHKLYGAYNQDHIPVIEQNEAVGHAVRAVYMYAGMTDIAALYEDADYLKAVNALWNNVVAKKMYITGGIGARHEGESFGDNYELPNLTAYNETCAAIGNVQWNHRLYMLTSNSKYYDIIERSLYNGLISGISLDGKTFFYPNPLESDAHFIFNHGSCTRSEWFDCSCCPTNLIRFIPSIPNLLYATRENTAYVNLYMSNESQLILNGKKVSITQTSDQPWGEKTLLTISPEKPADFTLKLRIPGWVRNEVLPSDLYQYIDEAPGTFTLQVNGEAVSILPDETGYVSITRKWKAGDQIELTFPMKVRKVETNSVVLSNKGLLALEYGPVVYCLEEKDNPKINALTLGTDEELKAEWKADMLGGITVLKNNKLMAIPYYAWSNRGVNKMKVWVKAVEGTPVQVHTDKGTIEGLQDEELGINRFLGIPYAKPPVGELRWKAPQTMDPWEGVVQTKMFGPRAVQENVWGDMVYRSNGMSEDCLYLNVWAPAGKNLKDLPVLVYIYGGGFIAGDASEPRYDGANMASKGIVVVSMNYRLNIFGFLAHPELSAESPYHSSGNYGLLDQQAALQWVKNNIASFGGNPDQITLAGESAGSISVNLHMASPLSKDLLAAAIGESGAAIYPTFTPVPQDKAEQIGKEYFETAGYKNIEELRAMSTEEICSYYNDSAHSRFPLVIDGYFLPASVTEIFKAGGQAQIPLLAGWNSEEMSGTVFMQGLPYTPENYKKRLQERFPKTYKSALKLFPGGNEKEVELSATALASADFISYSTWKWCDLQLNHSDQPVYRYYYSKIRPPVDHKKQSELTGIPYNVDPNGPPPKTLGASHSAEIAYCLGNLPLLVEYPWKEDDYKTSETMQGYFENFIKTGNPNGEGLPEWPKTAISQDNRSIMQIDVDSKAINSEEERYQFLDKSYRNE